jgi:hypothetical protein
MLTLDIKEQVIIPALQAISLADKNGIAIVWATGMVETNYEALVQHPVAKAFGFWQCENIAHISNKQFLTARPNALLLQRILAATYRYSLPSDDNALIWDLRYAAIMCRVHYLRMPGELPDVSNPGAVYQYYKKYYNTSEGAATYERDILAFQKACET